MNTLLVLALIGAVVLGLVLCWVPGKAKFGLLLLVLSFASGSWFWWQARGYRQAFDSVIEGDTEATVLETMGTPDKITNGRVTVYGGTKREAEMTPGCTSEFWYMAVLTPEQWAICLDERGSVVGKYYYASY